MSNVDAGQLATYNSLVDPHLSGYFSNQRLRRHLRHSGLIRKNGEIVSENTYRLNMARKEHKKHVRDMLAQAIVHKALDMERNRQVVIKNKLEEIAKIELVRRVRGEPESWQEMINEVLDPPPSPPPPQRNHHTQTTGKRGDRARKGDEDLLPLLSARAAKSSRTRSRPSSGVSSVSSHGRKGSGRPKSAPAPRSRSRKRSQSLSSYGSESSTTMEYYDESMRPVSPHRSGSADSTPRPASRSAKSQSGGKKKIKYPKGEIDDRHLYALDRATLEDYLQNQYKINRGRSSPYMMSQLPPDMIQPSPPSRGSPRSPPANQRSRRRVQPTDKKGKPTNKNKAKMDKSGLMLHRTEPAVKGQEQIQTFVEVSMHYFGSSLKLDYERFDPRDHVTVEQQHCGGNTLLVFNEKILPSSDFKFFSRRHHGYPFSLSLYVNGVFDRRLSTCCEYKHQSGSRHGHFGVVTVKGARPCYKCKIEEDMKNKQKKKKQKNAYADDDDDWESDNAEEEDDNEEEERRKLDTGPTVKVPVDDASDIGVDGHKSIPVNVDKRDKRKKDDDYDDDFSGSESTHSSRSSSSRSSASSRSSRSSVSHVPSEPEPVQQIKEDDGTVPWTVNVTTSKKSKAGTDANVFLVLHGKNDSGDYKQSKEIKLDNTGDNFESGRTDKFDVKIEDVGVPYKIRIGHDDSGTMSGWHLKQVEMENKRTNNKYLFKCNRWLSRDEDDAAIMRELPASGKDIKKLENVVTYVVTTYTGTKFGAGTDANVFCNLFGEQGDTGDRKLALSTTHKNKFERGNYDEFNVEAVDLKKLQKIRIGHDGSSSGAGWYLDKVIVKNKNKRGTEQVFECNRWLDVDEGDGSIVTEIGAGDSKPLSTKQYKISVKTGDIRQAGTDADVFIKLCGDKGDSGKLQLKDPDNHRNKFERDFTDEFTVNTTDIGKLESIVIGHDGSGIGDGWFVSHVRVEEPATKESLTFHCDRWLDKGEEDGKLEVELKPGSYKSSLSEYKITVKTGDIRGAGTDANVFVQLYGDKGNTDVLPLKDSGNTNKFERDNTDEFTFKVSDIGKIEKASVSHDGKGFGAGWFLAHVNVKAPSGETMFICDRWLDSGKEDGKLSVNLTPESSKTGAGGNRYDSDSGSSRTFSRSSSRSSLSSSDSPRHVTKKNDNLVDSASDQQAGGSSSARSIPDDEGETKVRTVRTYDGETASQTSALSVRSDKSNSSRRSKGSQRSSRSSKSSSRKSSAASSVHSDTTLEPPTPRKSAIQEDNTSQSGSDAIPAVKIHFATEEEETGSVRSGRSSASRSSRSSQHSGAGDNSRSSSPDSIHSQGSHRSRSSSPGSKHSQSSHRSRSHSSHSSRSRSRSNSSHSSHSRSSSNRSRKSSVDDMEQVTDDEMNQSGEDKRVSHSDSEDAAGGHDPDNVADGDADTKLGTLDLSSSIKHDGSIRPLVIGHKEIDLTSKSLNRTQVHELCEGIRDNGYVQSLILRNSDIDSLALGQIARALKETPASDLRMINLNCNQLDPAGVSAVLDIVSEKTNLEILLLHGNALGEAGVTKLTDGLTDLHKSRLTDEDRLSVDQKKAIRSTAKDLLAEVMKEAMGSEEDDTSLKLDEQPSTAIQGGLKLKQIDLGDCDLYNAGASKVAEMLKEVSSLEVVSLSGNKKISLPGWAAIADALSHTTNLHTLSLDFNELGDDGVALIAGGLENNTSLTAVDLDYTRFGEEGAQAILEMLKVNSTLRDITLMPGNNLNNDTLQEIKDTLFGRTTNLK